MNNSRFEGPLPEEIRSRYSSSPVSPSRLPPQPPFVSVPLPVRSEPPKSRAPIALLLVLGFFAFGFFLIAISHNSSSPSSLSEYKASPVSPAVPPEAPRSNPVAPRAELVAPRALPVVGVAYTMRMPDGSLVNAIFRGYLNDVSDLPRTGGLDGDMYGIGHNLWILTSVSGTSKVGWVDP